MHTFEVAAVQFCGCAACAAHDRAPAVIYASPSGAQDASLASTDLSVYYQSILVTDTTKIGQFPGLAASVSYSFMDTLPDDYTGSSHASGFQAMSAEVRSVMRDAFAEIEAVAGLTFVETNAEDATIRIGTNSQSASAGYAFLPNYGGDYSSDIWLSNEYVTAGDFVRQLSLHEIGHALGLSHTFEATNGVSLPTSLDSTDNSVMSYTWTGSTTLGPIDIAALQFLYGTATGGSFALGNVFVGDDGANTHVGSGVSDYIHGAGGDDYLVLEEGDDGTYAGDGGDTVLAGGGADLVYGNHGLDHILGWYGADTIYGGQNGGELTWGEGNAPAYRSGVETIYGNYDTDLIYGNHGTDLLLGGDQKDTIYGGQDDDTLSGGDDRDALFGNLGDDLLFGGDGWDSLFGGSGADTVSSGLGRDAVYGGDGDDLLINTGDDRLGDDMFGGAGRDTLSGGAGLDLLTGGLGDDQIYAGGSHDNLYGGEGNDTLDGGGGNDRLYSGLGDDVLVGGDGVDRFVMLVDQGLDEIQDFETGSDFLKLNDFTVYATSAEAYAAMRDTSNGAFLPIGDGSGVTFVGLSVASLSEHDITWNWI